nr:FAD-binding protein [Kocuria palustris]
MGYEIQSTGAPAPSGTGSAEPPRRPPVDEQENEANLGGQAHWPFGGMFLVDSPMQRRLGVLDSFELPWQDWQGSAGWDRLEGEHPEDEWVRQWGRAYVEFAADDKLPWLKEQGVKCTPLVGWAERGDLTARGHGNSVPKFHVPGAPALASPTRSSPRLGRLPNQVWCAWPSGTRSTA